MNDDILIDYVETAQVSIVDSLSWDLVQSGRYNTLRDELKDKMLLNPTLEKLFAGKGERGVDPTDGKDKKKIYRYTPICKQNTNSDL